MKVRISATFDSVTAIVALVAVWKAATWKRNKGANNGKVMR